MKLNRTKNQQIWLSSDLHFNHKNIIKYCDRNVYDYSLNDSISLDLSVEAMNEEIIRRHNSLVKEDDYYICGGDIGFGKDVEANVDLLDRMNGHKLICWGNHDHDIKWFIKREGKDILWTGDILELSTQVKNGKNLKKQNFFICHYPVLIWNQHHKGSIMIFGHTHHTLKDENYLSRKVFEIGLDGNNLFPYNIDDIYKQIKENEIKYIDHHNEETN